MKNYFYISAILLSTSCNLFKPFQKKSDDSASAIPTINLDTVETFEENNPLISKVYQPAATRLTDIIHTKLDVKFDWDKQYMYGKATITAKPHFYPTSQLVLDARGMELKEVSFLQTIYDTSFTVLKAPKGKKTEPIISTSTISKPLKYYYSNDVVTIDLPRQYNRTEQYTIFISYIAKPNEIKNNFKGTVISGDKGLYFINPDGKDKSKPRELWTQGETQSASAWFPTIDRPNQRMTQEIYITAEKNQVTLSNGELVSTADNGDNTHTDYWRMDLPHAPYLAMMAVGEFAIVKDKWKDKEVNYYVEKQYEPFAKAIFGNTPEMIEFYSNKLGVQYPWNKYSQIVVRDFVSGAMENTTATLHGETLNLTDHDLADNTREEYISHELFHQWFGDLVTTESWSNLPLNESFATYGEYLWEEYKYSRDIADAYQAESADGYFGEALRKQNCLIRFYYNDKEEMFDAHSYNKGGQVLHMLRKYVGDDAFFTSLKIYLETNKFQSVEIHNLRLAFEKITGEDLNWFFNQWFLSSGHPDIDISSDYDESTKKARIIITQKQNLKTTTLFTLPLDVDVYASGKVERKKIIATHQTDTFIFESAVKPDLINVDAEKQLLCTKSENKSHTEFAFQFHNAPLYLDRYEALLALSQKPVDEIGKTIILEALNDKHHQLRVFAINTLLEIPNLNLAEIKPKLIKLAESDATSAVRATALYFLLDNYKDEDLEKVYNNVLTDKSYIVLSAGIAGLAKTNHSKCMQIAKQYENEKSTDLDLTIGDLYAEYGTEDQNNFFVSKIAKYKGFAAINFLTQYSNFLKNNKSDELVNSGVALFAELAMDASSINWVGFYAKKCIKDLELKYEEKEKAIAETIAEKLALNPSNSISELEKQKENAKKEKEKINEVYSSLPTR